MLVLPLMVLSVHSYPNATLSAFLVPSLWAAFWPISVALLIQIFLQGKVLPWIMALAGVQSLSKGASAWLLALAIAAIVLHQGDARDQISMRVSTYAKVFKETLRRPVSGFGYSDLAAPIMLHKTKAPLPSIHSDFLSLAFHSGWIAAVLASLLTLSVVRWGLMTEFSKPMSASLVSLSGLCLFQNALSQPFVILSLLWLTLWTIAGNRTQERSF